MPRTSGAARTAPRPSGVPQGTPGGVGASAAKHRAQTVASVGSTTFYLWLLVAIEVALMSYLRHSFRRHHGG